MSVEKLFSSLQILISRKFMLSPISFSVVKLSVGMSLLIVLETLSDIFCRVLECTERMGIDACCEVNRFEYGLQGASRWKREQ